MALSTDDKDDDGDTRNYVVVRRVIGNHSLNSCVPLAFAVISEL